MTWGINNWGQLGRGTTTGTAQAPAVIDPGSLSDVVAISANGDQYRATSFAVKFDGTAWGWGHGQNGKLGNGSTMDQSAPTQVSTGSPPGTGMTNVVAVSPGLFHTLGLTSSGSVWAWGSRASGALGDGSTTSYAASPQPVTELRAWSRSRRKFLLAGAAVGRHAQAWGDNGSGQLGMERRPTD
jgi:hypothetical protein